MNGILSQRFFNLTSCRRASVADIINIRQYLSSLDSRIVAVAAIFLLLATALAYEFLRARDKSGGNQASIAPKPKEQKLAKPADIPENESPLCDGALLNQKESTSKAPVAASETTAHTSLLQNGSQNADSFEQVKKDELHSPPTEIAIVMNPVDKVRTIPDAPAFDIEAFFNELTDSTEAVQSSPHDRNCRFTDILCPLNNRFQAPGSTEQVYLHANHVRLEGLDFIATQYPLPHQVTLFWRAIQDVSLVIDLTNTRDMLQGLVAYYPALNEKKTYDSVNVTCKSRQVIQTPLFPLYCYEVNEGQLAEIDPSRRLIPRLHFEGWNDQRGVTEDQIDQLVTIMEVHQKDASVPILIHCRAGVGRTGTLMVARALSHLIKQGIVNAHNFKQHLRRLILEGRVQRGAGFVQSQAQIAALYKWAWRAIHLAQV